MALEGSISRLFFDRRKALPSSCLAAVLVFTGALLPSAATRMPEGREYTSTIGMKLMRIEAGSFRMGAPDAPLPVSLAPEPHQRNGDFDEKPRHTVHISKPFYMGKYEVTNAHYEEFDPSHRQLRGKLGYSKGDNEAVVFVTWDDARRFTDWLSKKEGLPYRLPTEAEWEYAARAGTSTAFHTGDALPEGFQKRPRTSWFPDPDRGKADAEPVDLTVGRTVANDWGLHDVHGNVEEWCYDWYGPYESREQRDPVGRAHGDFRVTRGGSHSTEPYFLRSANRMGTVPGDSSWLIGFRVVLGDMPKTEPLDSPPAELHQRNVSQTVPRERRNGPDASKPYFSGPRQYVKIPEGAMGPLFARHNHDPALVQAPNGDLLAIWYTCVREPGRELGLAASRLRHGEQEWESASPFWDAPDRNDHAPALWFDGKKTLYHFGGLSAAGTWGNTATILRTSNDSGQTWSPARLIIPEHGTRHMPVESVFSTKAGDIVVPADAVTGGHGGTALWISRDGGETWTDPGGTIAGIHAGVTQRKDGSLLAFGRGDNVEGRMPKSVSRDMGRTWETSASDFQPISGGQRLVLLRLQGGPLFFASFAKDMLITDGSGTKRPVSGLFGALSFDDGETWPVRRLVSDDGPGRQVETMDGRLFTMSWKEAEPRGYLSVHQATDGVIHLISSRQHYSFNLAWLKTPPPAGPVE